MRQTIFTLMSSVVSVRPGFICVRSCIHPRKAAVPAGHRRLFAVPLRGGPRDPCRRCRPERGCVTAAPQAEAPFSTIRLLCSTCPSSAPGGRAGTEAVWVWHSRVPPPSLPLSICSRLLGFPRRALTFCQRLPVGAGSRKCSCHS